MTALLTMSATEKSMNAKTRCVAAPRHARGGGSPAPRTESTDVRGMTLGTNLRCQGVPVSRDELPVGTPGSAPRQSLPSVSQDAMFVHGAALLRELADGEEEISFHFYADSDENDRPIPVRPRAKVASELRISIGLAWPVLPLAALLAYPDTMER